MSGTIRRPTMDQQDGESRQSKTLMKVDEVADLIGFTVRGVYSLVEARRIPFIRISNRVRFDEDDVLRWLQENRVPALERDQ